MLVLTMKPGERIEIDVPPGQSDTSGAPRKVIIHVKPDGRMAFDAERDIEITRHRAERPLRENPQVVKRRAPR